ncbi:rod shape-determining protein MreC [Paracidovorax valerianellae]|uniref:rod shape-determining protein MreC n=1 Tax=Paracidovorax valerianellae TaxID=187868 RepID=UPI0023026F60|nr:rod shape-determining protein MreC [Paracidovorax valerianellae]MDA8444581.1 rod shape-determining protein MreC [Paracidovorax valerianellae]
MPLGTLDRSAPSFFKQGPSPRSRLALYCALALFLMVADARFQVTDPLRKAVAVALYPVQWAMLQPVEFASRGAGYFQSLQVAQDDADTARRNMAQMSQRANQAEQLLQENARLRKLLDLRERLTTPAQAAQVIYDAADPYTRRVMIDRGQSAGVELGSPVMDESGMLGQVTRVHPFLSEVTLLIDRDQAIPVMNLRTGARSVAYGDPVIAHGGGMELRFMPGNADVQENDLLTTSGVDGLYPPGLPVARVVRVERRADSAFARIYCAPLAQVNGARHVMVLKPLTADLPERPAPAPVAPVRKGARR